MTAALLAVRDLDVRFPTPHGEARAVDGVSFDVAPGETLALVGESGCGKTATALALLRLLPPQARIAPEGRVEFQGDDLLALPERTLRTVRGAQIAMIFQEPMTSLNPVLTIGTQICEAIEAHEPVNRERARARAADMLALVGLADPAERLAAYPHQLSGGMRQRVLIAMALALRPKLLIADEPTTALDVTIQAQIIELLHDLKARLGMAMLLITHNLGIAAGIADRVAVMYAGRIVETGPSEPFFAAPVHPYAAALLEAAPRLDGPRQPHQAIPGTVPAATEWPHGCRFHPRCRLAWDRCRTEEPGLLVPSPERAARCWLVAEPERRSP